MNTKKHGFVWWGETPGEPLWQFVAAREDARPTNRWIGSGHRVHPCASVVE